MHFKNGRYYFVHRNKWHPLERDYVASVSMYAIFVKKTSPEAIRQLEQHVDDYMEYVRARLSVATTKNYTHCARAFKKVFTEFVSLAEIRPKHLGQWKQKLEMEGRPASWNLYHSFMSGFFKFCIEGGRDSLETNPIACVEKLKTQTRQRLIQDDELERIYEHSNEIMQCAILLADQIGQRVSDIRNLKKSVISEDGIYILQSKTGKKLRIKMTPQLKQVIDRISTLCPVVDSEYLFHHTSVLKKGKAEAGRPFGYSTWYGYWADACQAAGVEDANFHDIRARVATTAHKEGKDAKNLLGHSHQQTTDGYIRDRTVKEVEPLVRKMSKPGARKGSKSKVTEVDKSET